MASESIEDPSDVKAEEGISKDLAQVHDIPSYRSGHSFLSRGP